MTAHGIRHANTLLRVVHEISFQRTVLVLIVNDGNRIPAGCDALKFAGCVAAGDRRRDTERALVGGPWKTVSGPEQVAVDLTCRPLTCTRMLP